jgi:hypothetical protein
MLAKDYLQFWLCSLVMASLKHVSQAPNFVKSDSSSYCIITKWNDMWPKIGIYNDILAEFNILPKWLDRLDEKGQEKLETKSMNKHMHI